MGDVKKLYADLRVNMPDLRLDSKQFRGFDKSDLNRACRYLKVNAYIFDCELSDGGNKGSPACLNWRSDFIEGGIRINMLEYENHLMFIKDLKCLFKQWSCGKCKRCFASWAFDTVAKENKFHLFPPRHADIGALM